MGVAVPVSEYDIPSLSPTANKPKAMPPKQNIAIHKQQHKTTKRATTITVTEEFPLFINNSKARRYENYQVV